MALRLSEEVRAQGFRAPKSRPSPKRTSPRSRREPRFSIRASAAVRSSQSAATELPFVSMTTKRKKTASLCSRRPSIRGCYSNEIRRCHQVDTRGARPSRSLAIDLGLTPQALDQRLKSKTMKVETLCQTAAQLNYSVKLVPNDGGESIEIEG